MGTSDVTWGVSYGCVWEGGLCFLIPAHHLPALKNLYRCWAHRLSLLAKVAGGWRQSLPRMPPGGRCLLQLLQNMSGMVQRPVDSQKGNYWELDSK